MPVYVVAQGRVENRDMLNEYTSKVVPTIQSGGGRILGFDESPEVVEGEVDYPRTVILEFPSHEAFSAWYNSDGYQAAKAKLDGGVERDICIVEGLE